MTEILCARKITKAFSDIPVFKDFNLSLKNGEILALVGPSGIGKTTLLNILSGVMPPDAGNVYLNGEDITGKPGNISYMQQKDLLLPYYTVLENVALPLIIKGKKKKEAMKKASEYFAFFGIAGYESKYPKEMSGGMKQRAALLRTYIQSHDVILLDEPFGALDAVTRSKMQKWFLGIANELSLSAVIITHDTDEALILADRVIILKDAYNFFEIKIENKCEHYELTGDFLENKKIILTHLK